jgi:MOSC domain-containing protein YiiM
LPELSAFAALSDFIRWHKTLRQSVTMNIPHLASIHVGKVKPLGPEGVPSGFVKDSIAGPVDVTTQGIRGDEQADLSVHGGSEKAVYGYSFENYLDWQQEMPRHAQVLVPGSFGENLCIKGMRERDLCVGDIHRIGSALLQVCQPREPCFKLALRFNDKLMPKAMIRSGRSGWYYRVLETGQIAQGEPMELEERPNPEFPFSRLVALVARGDASTPELQMMQGMNGLAANWRAWARERLSHVG